MEEKGHQCNLLTGDKVNTEYCDTEQTKSEE